MQTIVLAVLDGFGIASPSRGNAIAQAKTPFLTSAIRDYPALTIHASGEMVGLPWGEKGNSEVGHLTIGSGRIIYQSLPLIQHQIETGEFFQNSAFVEAIARVKRHRSRLHLVGLCSSGGIHSHIQHLYALLDLAEREGVSEIYIHAFLDGRDTPHNAALKDISELQEHLKKIGNAKISTLAGRFWAMDRDNHWERIEKAYNAMAQPRAEEKDPVALIEESYRQGVFDEEFVPVTVAKEGNMRENDVGIFFNFRPDRARELTKAIVLPSFTKFPREYVKNFSFVTMMEYEKNLPVHIAFFPELITDTLSEVIARNHLHQLHIAETEKYAHVTYFFNGGREQAFEGEDRLLVSSKSLPSYVEAPEMSAQEITEKLLENIRKKYYDVMVVNFANADMVGHTGNFPATIAAIETLDACLQKIALALEAVNGSLIITGDHGNAEEMMNLETGEKDKEHSRNPVPFLLIGKSWKEEKKFWPAVPYNDLSRIPPSGILSDIAPTMLEMLGLPAPKDMTGRSLLRKKI